MGLPSACGGATVASVATLAVDDPETEEPLTEAVDADMSPLSRMGEYGGKSSLMLLEGEPMTLGGLRLSPIRRPVRSRPRSSSRRKTRPPPRPSRTLPDAYPAPMPIAEPVGEMLPMGEFVPLLDDRSRSEYDEFRVDDLPRDSDLESLESLEYEQEPVVVEPLTGEHPGERPRVGMEASVGERKPGSGGGLDVDCVAIFGTGTGIAGPWSM